MIFDLVPDFAVVIDVNKNKNIQNEMNVVHI